MRRAPGWRRHLRFFGPDPDADIRDEFRFHLETEIEELIERGHAPDEARRLALARFGDPDRFERDCRASDQRRLSRERRFEVSDLLRQDLRGALRSLRRHPLFSFITVATLALGIGANTAVFSVVNAVLLRPLAFREPERLVALWETTRDMPQILVSYPNYRDWRVRTRVFDDIAIYDGFGAFNLTGPGEAERVRGGLASGNLFPLLGARPVLGRLIGPGDDGLGAERVAVLAEGLWRSRFGADSAILGRSIRLDGVPHTVIGVIGSRYQLGPSEVWVALGPLTGSPEYARENHPGLIGIGRLKSGVTLEQMRGDLARVSRELAEEYPRENAGNGADGTFLAELSTGRIRPALLLLAGAVGLVLLVACANVANLLLGRAASRQREFALRVALGAGRTRIIRQVLTDGMVLALIGGALGVLLAWTGVTLLEAMQPATLPRLTEIRLDWTAVGFAALLSIVTGIGFGLAPALQAARQAPLTALNEEGRAGTGSRPRQRLRAALTVAEVALTLMLLVGAGLLIRSFAKLTRVETGVDPSGLTAALLRLPESGDGETTRQRVTLARILDEVRTRPGIDAAALTTDLPLSASWQHGVSFDGLPPAPAGSQPLLNAMVVSADYFRTMRVPVLAGRAFDSTGHPSALDVVVSQSVTERFFGAADPIGRRIKAGPVDGPEPWHTIIGVVGEVKHDDIGSLRSPRGVIYYPFGPRGGATSWIVVRSRGSSDEVSGLLREAVHAVDPEVPIASLRTLDAVIDGSLAQPRFSTVMVTVFAVLSLLLAAVGLYGVISHAVNQRVREIGVRMALGAGRRTVVAMVIGQSMALTALGILIGAVGAWLAGGAIARLLYGVTPSDPVVMGVVVVVVAAVALLASAAPAIRAARVDPATAIRGD